MDILQVELQDQFMAQQEDSQAHQVMEDLVEVQMEHLIQVVIGLKYIIMGASQLTLMGGISQMKTQTIDSHSQHIQV